MGRLVIIFILLINNSSYAYTLNQWADSIKKTEGTRWPYGIKRYGHISEYKARIICQRTIIHAWHDFRGNRHDAGAFIDYLANRYCPILCDRQGNINWKKNMRKIIRGLK